MKAKPVWQQSEREWWGETLPRVRRNYLAALRRDRQLRGDEEIQEGLEEYQEPPAEPLIAERIENE